MVIDTSALVAILEQEDGARSFAEAIAATATPLISAVSVVETGIVMVTRRGDGGGHDLDDLVRACRLEIIPFTEEHARLARDGFARFGKGRHAARLNFGDCISYALSKATGRPLLYKGDDFSRTDVEAASVRAELG
jgi:ribonuclease VapC